MDHGPEPNTKNDTNFGEPGSEWLYFAYGSQSRGQMADSGGLKILAPKFLTHLISRDGVPTPWIWAGLWLLQLIDRTWHSFGGKVRKDHTVSTWFSFEFLLFGCVLSGRSLGPQVLHCEKPKLTESWPGWQPPADSCFWVIQLRCIYVREETSRSVVLKF